MCFLAWEDKAKKSILLHNILNIKHNGLEIDTKLNEVTPNNPYVLVLKYILNPSSELKSMTLEERRKSTPIGQHNSG